MYRARWRSLASACVASLAFACASSVSGPPVDTTPSEVAPTATAKATASTTVDLSDPTSHPSTATPEPKPLPGAAPSPTPVTEPVSPVPERDFDVITLLPPDAIPAISNPGFYGSLEAADESYGDDDLVLGIEIDGDARAYSVPLLSRHEIVNDVVGGKPVAVTW